MVLGGLLGVLAVGGGAAWAASSLLDTGDQPAQALPAGTIGYLSVDLDPSGAQKVEAIQTLRKFPAFADQVDLDTDDDLRERLFTELDIEIIAPTHGCVLKGKAVVTRHYHLMQQLLAEVGKKR